MKRIKTPSFSDKLKKYFYDSYIQIKNKCCSSELIVSNSFIGKLVELYHFAHSLPIPHQVVCFVLSRLKVSNILAEDRRNTAVVLDPEVVVAEHEIVLRVSEDAGLGLLF